MARADGVFASLGEDAHAKAGRGQWKLEGAMRCLAWMRWPNWALFDAAVSKEEARAIIAAARPGLDLSLVSGIHKSPSAQRRSLSKSFSPGECPQADALQARLSRLLGVDPSRFEPLQATLYEDGGFYAPHRDHFHAGHPKAAGAAQRMATVVVYLSEPEQGGQTVMEELGIRFSPCEGFALYFAYPDDSSRELALHSSAPCEGEKWIATQWIRVGE